MTDVVAWLALVLSAASLGWQVVSWRKSGARILVEIVHRLDQPDRLSPGALIVIATNVGRQAVTINEIDVEFPALRLVRGNLGFGILISSGENFTLPQHLEPGAEIPMSVSASCLHESIDNDRPGATHVRVGVRAGNTYTYGKGAHPLELTGITARAS